MITYPYNQQIEQSCLCCALLNKDALKKVILDLDKDDFYVTKYGIIFKAILDIKITDYPALKEQCKKYDYDLTMIEYMELYEASTSSINVEYYIKQLKEYTVRRRIIKESQDAIQKAYIGDPSEIIHDLTNNLRLNNIQENVKPLTEIMGKEISKIQIQDGSFIKTGFLQLDMKLIGLFDELIILAARPSMGKTVLALNIAKNVSKEYPVYFFSLEQPDKDLIIRLLCSETNIEFKRLKISGKVDLLEMQKINEAYEKILKLKLFIYDQPVKASKIISICQKGNPRLIVTDYLQLIIPEDKKIQRHLQVQEITRSFKNYAKESRIPHILLCQLNRASEIRKDKRPILSDLRESGDIEQDADKIVFIHREFEAEKAIFIMAKNRNGECGTKDAIFNGQAMEFI